MAMTSKVKVLAISLSAASALLITAGVASATPIGQEVVSNLVSWSAGATDLNGNPVESKTYVGDQLPDDLGELEYEGTATVEK